MGNKRLRVSHVIIQPILVWDDGKELLPFKHQIKPIEASLSELNEIGEKIKIEIEELNKQQKELNN